MGRQKIVAYDKRISDRIKVGRIVNKLIAHIEDAEKTPMLTTQINAARLLMNKVIPDVQAIKHEVTDVTNHQGLSNQQLVGIIEGTFERLDSDDK